jgi:hypothetical protein
MVNCQSNDEKLNLTDVLRTTTIALLAASFASIMFMSSNALAFDVSHAQWNSVLQKYCNGEGWVSYRQLKSDIAQDPKHPFLNYIQDLSSVHKSEFYTWKTEDQKAFLINAYNALTVKLILDHYPLKSIKDVGGFFSSPWKKSFFSLLDGTVKNLETIENEMLRKHYEDARILSALSTASLSAPRLQPNAFVGSSIDQQLDKVFRDFVADPERNHFDSKGGVLELSKIFDWYGNDFYAFGGVRKVIQKYGPRSAQKALEHGGGIRFLGYDWGLNEPVDDRGEVAIPTLAPAAAAAK